MISKSRKMYMLMNHSAASILLLCFIVAFTRFSPVSSNAEGDALTMMRNNLIDPNNVLQSWNSTLINPCTWFHVTCNSDNSVTRIDLGNANLSGQLVSQLGQLQNLEYLELYGNNIGGRIPNELGNLTNLVSLDLYRNNLSGPIPSTLGRLQRLRFLRLHNNSLSGQIPVSLTTIMTLQVLDLSNNRLTGRIPVNGSFQFFTPISFANNDLEPYPLSPSPSPSSSPSQDICGKRCEERCSKAEGIQEKCMKECGMCCDECKCVPSDTYGNKHECPCYTNKKSSKGTPKCP